MIHFRFKRFTALLLALLFVFISAVPVSAAATAADMRLASVEGTVTLENASGRSMSVRDGMKLYNGYTVSTGKASYAYLTLDKEKAVKLDAESSLEVRKHGKKLELFVRSGQILFDVKNPLHDGEAMNIRTSTMVTGIRGTAGIVTAYADHSAIQLYEGNVIVSLPDRSRSVLITAGNSGLCDRKSVTLIKSSPADIPGFAAMHFSGDPQLVDRVEQATGWNLTAVVGQASAILARDEQNASEEQPDNNLPITQIYMTSGSSQPGDSVPDDIPSEPKPEPEPEPIVQGTITLTASITDADGAALPTDTDRTYAFTITADDGTARTESITVPAGASAASVTVSKLPQGAYTVTQSTAGLAGAVIASAADTYTYTSTSAAVSVTVSADALDHTAAFTNVYTLNPKGSITLTASITDSDGAALPTDTDRTYAFTITADDGTARTESITVPAGASTASVTVSKLPQGAYTIIAPSAVGDTLTQGNAAYTFMQFTPSQQNCIIAVDTLDAAVTLTAVYQASSYTVYAAATAAELQGYLNSFPTVTLTASNTATEDSNSTIAGGETVTVPKGTTLVLAEWVSTGDTAVSHNLTNNGTIINNGTVHIRCDSAFSIAATGIIENHGAITLAAGTNNGIIRNYADAVLTFDSYTYKNYGTIDIASGSTMSVDTFYNEYELDTDGQLITEGVLNVEGALIVEYVLHNSGTMTLKSGASVKNTAYYESTVSAVGLINAGKLTVETGCTFTNDGDFSNSGTLTNNGTIVNNVRTVNFTSVDEIGTFINNSIFINNATFLNGYQTSSGSNSGGTVENHGSIENNASAMIETHAGTFTNLSGGTVTNRGTVSIGTGFKIPGHFANEGTLDVYGTFTVAADPSGTSNRQTSSLTNSGHITVHESGTLDVQTNYGILNNTGTITNNGTYTNTEGTFTNTGTLDGTNPIPQPSTT